MWEILPMTFGEELARLMKAKGLTQQKLADMCKVNQTFVGKLMRSDKTRLGADVMLAICAAVDVPMDHFAPYLAPGATVPPPPSLSSVLPDYGEVPCGPPSGFAGEAHGMTAVPPEFVGDGRFVMHARGSSMTGHGILAGDKLIVQAQATADTGQVVVATVDGAATLKLMRRRKGTRTGAVELAPHGDGDGVPIPYPSEGVVIHGVLLGVVRRL